MAKVPKPDLDESTLRIMGVLGRMPPKPHAQMKLGNKNTGKKESDPKDRTKGRPPK